MINSELSYLGFWLKTEVIHNGIKIYILVSTGMMIIRNNNKIKKDVTNGYEQKLNMN